MFYSLGHLTIFTASLIRLFESRNEHQTSDGHRQSTQQTRGGIESTVRVAKSILRQTGRESTRTQRVQDQIDQHRKRLPRRVERTTREDKQLRRPTKRLRFGQANTIAKNNLAGTKPHRNDQHARNGQDTNPIGKGRTVQFGNHPQGPRSPTFPFHRRNTRQ